MSEDKVRTKDFCWSVGTIYNPRKLLGVSTTGLGIGRGVTTRLAEECKAVEQAEPEPNDWRVLIIRYIKNEEEPYDKAATERITRQSTHYVVISIVQERGRWSLHEMHCFRRQDASARRNSYRAMWITCSIYDSCGEGLQSRFLLANNKERCSQPSPKM
jgi:hypothetical protein